ncbi:mucosal addressin cell adhesion molecule 1 [Pleurodeles waltl]|uniref:mucosal addressin cell adhesion molecule 1 n=1 Tax=Pleurodeles waltl TaxID=8319 RepID=UPI003709B8DA
MSEARSHPFRRERLLSLLPEDPLVHLGDPVQFNCSMPCLEATFTWKGLDTKAGQVTSTPRYSLLYIASTALHNEGSIICEATCQGRRAQRTSRLQLYSLPDTMQVAHHPEGVSGQPAHLSCSIRWVYPLDALTLSWYRGEERLETPEQQLVSSEEDDREEVQSFQLRLDLPGMEVMEGAEYRCEAELSLEEGTRHRNKTLNFSPHNGHAVDPTTAPSEDCSTCGTVITNSNPTNEPVTSTGFPTSETSTTRDTREKTAVVQVNATGATVQEMPHSGAITTRLNPRNKTVFNTVNPTETSVTSVNPTSETVTKLNRKAEKARKGSLRNETVTYRWKPTQVTSTSSLNPRPEAALYRKNPVNVTSTATLNPTTETVAYGASPKNKMVMFTKNPTNWTVTFRVTHTNETAAVRDNPTAVNPTSRRKPRTETLTTRIKFTTETALAKGVDGTENPKRKITAGSRRTILGTLNTGATDSIALRSGYFGTKPTFTPGDNTALTISSKSHPTERVPPKPGPDADSATIWSVFSFLGLLTSGLGVHQLNKRLRFLGKKKASFDLTRL